MTKRLFLFHLFVLNLELVSVLHSLILNGKVFHCSAALIEKVVSPKCVDLNPTRQSPLVEDLVDLVPFLERVTKSLSGGGARALRIFLGSNPGPLV